MASDQPTGVTIESGQLVINGQFRLMSMRIGTSDVVVLEAVHPEYGPLAWVMNPSALQFLRDACDQAINHPIVTEGAGGATH